MDTGSDNINVEVLSPAPAESIASSPQSNGDWQSDDGTQKVASTPISTYPAGGYRVVYVPASSAQPVIASPYPPRPLDSPTSPDDSSNPTFPPAAPPSSFRVAPVQHYEITYPSVKYVVASPSSPKQHCTAPAPVGVAVKNGYMPMAPPALMGTQNSSPNQYRMAWVKSNGPQSNGMQHAPVLIPVSILPPQPTPVYSDSASYVPVNGRAGMPLTPEQDRDDDQLKCPICQKAFTRPFSVKRHILSHVGKKPYRCDICNERFRQRHHLTDHRRIHSGEKPYFCDVCKKEFRQSSNLMTHRRRHHPEKAAQA